ncbi:hypothetical protein [Streptosporangium sp. V21-05]|uniref:hypothetical protein n=1 Tax=Streptosporangium sp. V21-05 TaxID=3446115 RepID=UPI003F530ADE
MTMTDWIRPWWPGGATGHIYADCEQLLHATPEPQEGPGWLNPRGDRVCESCLEQHTPEPAALAPSWDATCDTCHWSMEEEWDDYDRPFTKDDAQTWQDRHECEPSVRLIQPAAAEPVLPPAAPACPEVPGQHPLFDLKDAA